MISIIIPLYNKEHYILDTINSVFCQTNKDWECVIVDDGSTDRGPELVKNIHDSRIKYLKKKNGGVSSANAVLLKDVGADILVAGSSVFGAADRKKAIDVLRS